MKNIVSRIALVVLVATIAAPAHAGVMETVKGYWNSARTHASNAAQAVANVPSWFSSNYFFAKHVQVLPAIIAKLDNLDAINAQECQVAYDAIMLSKTLPFEERVAHGNAIAEYAKQEQAARNTPELIAARTALTTIMNNSRAQLKKIGIATAVAATCIATVYAYKRITARKSIPGWC